jgi:hypothetical protein
VFQRHQYPSSMSRRGRRSSLLPPSQMAPVMSLSSTCGLPLC